MLTLCWLLLGGVMWCDVMRCDVMWLWGSHLFLVSQWTYWPLLSWCGVLRPRATPVLLNQTVRVLRIKLASPVTNNAILVARVEGWQRLTCITTVFRTHKPPPSSIPAYSNHFSKYTYNYTYSTYFINILYLVHIFIVYDNMDWLDHVLWNSPLQVKSTDSKLQF